MPKLFTAMAWNIENYGASKYKKTAGGPELLDLIQQVITNYNIDVIGFSEIRSNLGNDIGRKLTKRLNGGPGGAPWTYEESAQYGKKRWEQYLFVWNTNVVTNYKPFKDTFANPAPPPASIGFPRQKTTDRPPFLGYFRTVAAAPNRDILVAVMHAPEPGFALNTRDAARNMATVTQFGTKGDSCVLMGDFNVKTNAVEATANSNGAAAFGPLINLAPDAFEQAMVNGGNEILTSLIARKTAWVGMAVGDYFNQPYDQIFVRDHATISYQNEGVYDLVEDAVNGNFLEPSLVALWNAVTGNAIANFNAVVEDAFVAYRMCVSDHFPVAVEIHE